MRIPKCNGHDNHRLRQINVDGAHTQMQWARQSPPTTNQCRRCAYPNAMGTTITAYVQVSMITDNNRIIILNVIISYAWFLSTVKNFFIQNLNI